MLFKKEQEPLIQFVSTVPGLIDIEECRPKPAKTFIPQWWKDTPSMVKSPDSDVYPILRTVKVCPSFPDYFSQGYVIPMWADTTLWHDQKTDNWYWRSGIEREAPYLITPHDNSQFLNHTSANFLGIEGTFVFKLICPWRIITPKNYSVLQLPMFFHYNQEFSVVPGITNGSIQSEINQQIIYHGKGKEIFIPRGTPIAQYIPVKTKDTAKYLVRESTEKDRRMFDYQSLDSRSVFYGGYRNRKNKIENQEK
jgi:hypothetical protein